MISPHVTCLNTVHVVDGHFNGGLGQHMVHVTWLSSRGLL